MTYLDWILDQTHDGYEISKVDEDNLKIESKMVEGNISIYHFEQDIVELSLVRKSDDENVFFLHFELKDEQHAHTLFHELEETLIKENNKTTINVLLSCTSGLTTSFFANALNESAQLLKLDYTFEAVAYASLYGCMDDYDIIMLAPQIAYEFDKLKEMVPDKILISIPASIFASYDTGEMLDIIKEEIVKKNTTKEEMAQLKVMRNIENDVSIFTITMIHDSGRTSIGYRLYDKGEIVENERVIKTGQYSLKDIKDIIESHLCMYKKKYTVDAISICLPGMMRKHSRDSEPVRILYRELEKEFTETYGVPVFMNNNTNGVVLGYYAGQDQYDIITYHSQPKNRFFAGQGIVYKGMLVEGANDMGGEVEGICRMDYPDIDQEQDALSMFKDSAPERVRDMVVKYLVSNICIINPEVILLRSPFTPDIEGIKREVSKYVSDRVMPDMVYLRDVSEYVFLGSMLLGLEGLKHK